MHRFYDAPTTGSLSFSANSNNTNKYLSIKYWLHWLNIRFSYTSTIVLFEISILVDKLRNNDCTVVLHLMHAMSHEFYFLYSVIDSNEKRNVNVHDVISHEIAKLAE